MSDLETPLIKMNKKMRKSISSKFEEKFYNVVYLNRNIVPITRLLYGKEICVINGNDKISKENIEDELLLHNAKIVQNQNENTYCVIVGNPEKVLIILK